MKRKKPNLSPLLLKNGYNGNMVELRKLKKKDIFCTIPSSPIWFYLLVWLWACSTQVPRHHGVSSIWMVRWIIALFSLPTTPDLYLAQTSCEIKVLAGWGGWFRLYYGYGQWSSFWPVDCTFSIQPKVGEYHPARYLCLIFSNGKMKSVIIKPLTHNEWIPFKLSRYSPDSGLNHRGLRNFWRSWLLTVLIMIMKAGNGYPTTCFGCWASPIKWFNMINGKIVSLKFQSLVM